MFIGIDGLSDYTINVCKTANSAKRDIVKKGNENRRRIKQFNIDNTV